MSRIPIGAHWTREASGGASERGREVVAAWATPSTHGAALYETVLYADGSLSCNCPGWVYPRNGRPRACRHTRAYETLAPGLLAASAATGPSTAGTRHAGGGSGASTQPLVVRGVGSGPPRRRFDVS
jgi:hypothetical protein